MKMENHAHWIAGKSSVTDLEITYFLDPYENGDMGQAIQDHALVGLH